MIDGIHMHVRIQVNRHVRMYMKLSDKKTFPHAYIYQVVPLETLDLLMDRLQMKVEWKCA